MASNLEEAIELSKDCCEKKKLLVYGISYGRSYDGEPDKTSFVCANCRTHYYWSSDEQVARKSESKMSDEGIYQAVELYIRFWRNVKDHSPNYIESFTKSLNLDKSRVEKIIRKSELYSEYGYNINDEKEIEVEGVTLVYAIKHDEFLVYNSESLEEFESIVNKLVQPYKLIAEKCRKAKLQNKIFWEPPFSDGNRLAMNVNGPACEIKDVLEQLIDRYGLPYAICKPNVLFKDADTEEGAEIAKEICLKKGGQIKKPSLLESKLFYKNGKYIISGNKRR